MLASLNEAQPLAARLAVLSPEDGSLPRAVGLKLYTLGDPLALSDVLPTLENFGLRVVRQDPTEILPRDGGSQWLQAFEVSHPGCSLPAETQRAYFEAAFLASWNGLLENDGLNRLVLGAGLDARQVTIVRALTRYLLQTGLPFSQNYIETILDEHAATWEAESDDVAVALGQPAPTELATHAVEESGTRKADDLYSAGCAAHDERLSLTGERGADLAIHRHQKFDGPINRMHLHRRRGRQHERPHRERMG